ncbi:MAG: hypothetical protein HUU06_01380 [Planctomycetaceae bacterium]|nr:hypothetical protein [Planctomycetaceae bacterium]
MEVTADELARDGKGAKLQTPTDFTCQDGAVSPLISPQPFDTDVDFLTVPANAVALRVNPTEDLRYSADGNDIQSTVTDGYMVAPANQETPIPVAALVGLPIYFTQDSAGGSLRFRFDLIGS